MKNIRFAVTGLSIALASLLTGCASTPSTSAVARAEIGPASGSQVKGSASFTRIAGGLHLAATVSGLTPGEHGFHVHEVGDCSAPDATSAKGHYNPAGSHHGGQGGEHHAGDMPNLVADASGNASFSADLLGLDVGAGNDVANRALVIHADPDDYKSQPAGNSGKRVACGVIKAG
jgi:Cu-Zn family superoxide dismutase